MINMKTAITFLFLCLVGQCFAQKKYHTYISDRSFNDPSDLVGYVFRPSMYEVPYQEKRDIKAGKYVFSITSNKLFVEGDSNIQGIYNINNIKPAEYGYQLLLMNARSPELQGHLKVVLNDKKQVDALIFRRSAKDQEIIYFQAKIPSLIAEKEKKYFTDKGELIVYDETDLWGNSFHPFFRIFSGGAYERVYAADSVKINFIRKGIMKGKRNYAARTVSMDDAFTTKGIKEPKVEYEYFIEVRSYVIHDSGYRSVMNWKYPVQKVMRQAENMNSSKRRYHYEVQIKKDDPINIYLSPDRALHSIEIEGITYAVRE